MRRVALLLLALALAAPGPALAQGVEPPAPSRPAPQWSAIPDLVPYVSFAIPQCGAGITATRSYPPVVWTDLGSVVMWLAHSIESTMLSVVCWFAAFGQHLANWLAAGVNALLAGLNYAVRLLTFLMLWGTYLAVDWGFYLVELARSWGWDTRDAMATINSWLSIAWSAGLAVISFIGQFVQLIGRTVMAVLGFLSYIGAIVYTVFLEMINVATWTPTGQLLASGVPAPLETTYPLYCGVRGGIDGVFDSDGGWMLYILIAMAYVVWIMWMSRFFSGGKAAQ